MDTDQKEGNYRELTEKIINMFYRVYNTLGYGFLGRVYENAMMIEFEKAEIQAVSQSPIGVLYDEKAGGEYYADILVDGKVIAEIKAARILGPENEAQLLNYLKATEVEVGLLLNFGPRPQIKREVFDNQKK
jgi:GxxExxY protein